MRRKFFAKLKKSAILCLILSLVLSFSACNIIFNEDDGATSTPSAEEDLSNGVITEGIINANFTVMMASYNVSILGNVIEENTTQGSGVIFEKEQVLPNLYSYALLTNNHVIYKDTLNYHRFECSVRDCFGNIYRAEVSAYDPNYDLAVVVFNSEVQYKVLEFASKNPKAGDQVVSIGQPRGIINAVTEGKVEKYLTVTVPTEGDNVNVNISNVNFEVIKHSAPINQGSSGGVLLDKNYKICGINYAAAVVQDSTEFVSGYAIPVLKVKRFLNEKYYVE